MTDGTSTPAGTTRRIADRLRVAARARFVGRERELERLERAIVDEHTPVTFLHGLGGIGKSALLGPLAARLTARGCRVLRVDGREVTPTHAGFVSAVGQALGAPGDSLESVVAALEPTGATVLVVDEFDSLRLLDSWLRREFVPALPESARVLLVGRGRPLSGWTSAGWDSLTRSFELGPLSEADAHALVDDGQLPHEQRERIVMLAKGHPLALGLARAAARSRPELPVAELESRHVLGQLVERFLGDSLEPHVRALIEAASVLRRVNRPALDAVLGDGQGEHALEVLRSMPFAELARDGIVLHPSVRSAVASALRAVDPERHRELRVRAWHHAAGELVKTPPAQRSWHLTADILYLLDEPGVRDAFFPTDTQRLAIDAAQPEDRAAVFDIASRHAGAIETERLAHWWRSHPAAFFVARDEVRAVRGFYAASWSNDVPAGLAEQDPVLAAWQEHHRARFGARERPAMYVRTILARDFGSQPSEARAACFLDLERAYMTHLDLLALYTSHYHGGEHSLCDRMGFENVKELRLDGEQPGSITTQLLDFGPGVIHWLGRLMEAQWEHDTVSPLPRGVALCHLGRQLLVDGEGRPLTRLEFGVLDHLEQHVGRVCSRDELVESVWGQAHSGSNVVDAVIRTLRKKMGAHKSAIETVTGHGYRLRAGARENTP